MSGVGCAGTGDQLGWSNASLEPNSNRTAPNVKLDEYVGRVFALNSKRRVTNYQWPSADYCTRRVEERSTRARIRWTIARQNGPAKATKYDNGGGGGGELMRIKFATYLVTACGAARSSGFSIIRNRSTDRPV